MVPRFLWIAVLALSVPAQQKQSVGPADQEQRLQKVVDEMMVLVEKHSGLAFRKRPKVRAVKAKEWRDIVKQAYGIENALEMLDASFRTQGLYLAVTDEIVLSPMLVAPLIKETDEKAPRHVRELVARHKAIVAHELVHALQEQHFSLVSRTRLAHTDGKDADEIRRLKTVVEGHAVLVEELIVEEELGVEDYLQRGPYGTQSFYLTGRRYFLHLLRTSGMKAVRESLANPPTLAALLELANKPLPPPSPRVPTDAGGEKR